MNMLQKLDNYFGITRLGSTFRIELFAGLSTFLSLSYIFVVNPAILSAAGISTSVAFFATIFSSVVATLLMGLWARLPFALAPGLEMNAYIAFRFYLARSFGSCFLGGCLDGSFKLYVIKKEYYKSDS